MLGFAKKNFHRGIMSVKPLTNYQRFSQSRCSVQAAPRLIVVVTSQPRAALTTTSIKKADDRSSITLRAWGHLL